MQNPQFGSKIKIPKKHVKIHSTTHLQLFCDKNRSKKNTKYSRNEGILRIGHHAKAIAHSKSQFESELKIQKNMSKSILQLI